MVGDVCCWVQTYLATDFSREQLAERVGVLRQVMAKNGIALDRKGDSLLLQAAMHLENVPVRLRHTASCRTLQTESNCILTARPACCVAAWVAGFPLAQPARKERPAIRQRRAAGQIPAPSEVCAREMSAHNKLDLSYRQCRLSRSIPYLLVFLQLRGPARQRSWRSGGDGSRGKAHRASAHANQHRLHVSDRMAGGSACSACTSRPRGR